MFLLFVREKIAWILFIVLFLICINILFYLDSGFSGISVSYFNIVSVLLTISFLIWRYFKETRDLSNFLGNLSNQSNLVFSESLSLSPFQRKYIESIIELFEVKELLLNHTKIELQESSEDLISWVHEIKTPLTAMKLIIEQTEDQNTRKKLESEWMRIHLLLDQQLHNTRLATFENDNRLEKVVLRSIIFNEIREFQSWCMEKDIGFDIENLDQEVVTDKKWLAFIIRQILSNSIKYSHPNKEISIYTSFATDGHLLLHFRDCGMGIRKEDLPRIFNKSYTGTTGRIQSNSSGMGLYLAKNAASKLGITILVDSTINEGTLMTLRFPLQNEFQNVLGR